MIVDRARTRVLARPRMAFIISESAEPATIPLVLTFHSTTQLLKNIISRNFHLLGDDSNTAAIFNPCASCRHINVIRIYVIV